VQGYRKEAKLQTQKGRSMANEKLLLKKATSFVGQWGADEGDSLSVSSKKPLGNPF